MEHQDLRQALRRYDCPEMLRCVDPPHVTESRSRPKLHGHEMSEEDHHELVDFLLVVKGRAVVSGYTHPRYAVLERHR